MKPFHRYTSTIHGNYRRAYLRSGVLVGLLLAAYIIIRRLIGQPAQSPISLITDAILIISILLLSAYYRSALPEKQVTLKELMLFGIGTSLIAAITYGLLLWAHMSLDAPTTITFVQSLTGQTSTISDPQYHYWPPFITLLTLINITLLGSFASFLTAIILRTEKATPQK